MVNQKPESVWHVTGASVRGASHIRSHLPNQDDINWYPGTGQGLPIVLAVADGHGSPRSFRSDKGAELAVSTAVETMRDFMNTQSDTSGLTIPKRMAEEQLPREIVRRWRSEVRADWGVLNPTDASDTPFIAYGSTLLTVLVTSDFIIYLQIGDGDILTVWEDGEIESPVPGDDRLFANQTTSLCTEAAWRDFRFCFQPIFNTAPSLILLTTAGYANSFGDHQSFVKVASDIWLMIQSHGLEFIRQNLETWLMETSEKGSGDDITMGIICQIPKPDTSAFSHFSLLTCHFPGWI